MRPRRSGLVGGARLPAPPMMMGVIVLVELSTCTLAFCVTISVSENAPGAALPGRNSCTVPLTMTF